MTTYVDQIQVYGFFDSPSNVAILATAILVAILSPVTFVVARTRVRRKTLQQQLRSLRWRIEAGQVTFDFTKASKSSASFRHDNNRHDDNAAFRQATFESKRVGLFDMDDGVDADRADLLMEFKTLRDAAAAQNNIARFAGIYFGDTLAVVFECGNKGTLENLARNGELSLDRGMLYSLLRDVLSALAFIHRTGGAHGRLRSGVCVVDNRFSCKVTDVGLHSLRGRFLEQASSDR